jgi:hypothetical protein
VIKEKKEAYAQRKITNKTNSFDNSTDKGESKLLLKLN